MDTRSSIERPRASTPTWMIAWVAMCLCATGCEPARAAATSGSSTGTGLVVTNRGSPILVIACTREVFERRFPALRPGRSATAQVPPPGGAVGWYESSPQAMADGPVCYGACDYGLAVGSASCQCWFVCDDPGHPSGDELWYRDHEIAHAVCFLLGWEAARPLWERIRRDAPWAMTHARVREELSRAP